MNGRSGATVKAAGTGAAALLVAALLVPGTAAGDSAGGEAAFLDGGPEEVEMVVTGLSCPFCAYGLEKRLREEIEDLSDLEIEARTGKVTFRVEDGSAYTDDDLRDVVRKAGFRVAELDRKPDSGEDGERTW